MTLAVLGCETTDPGDLVLDPTCGSGTTAYVAEKWGLDYLPRHRLLSRLQ